MQPIILDPRWQDIKDPPMSDDDLLSTIEIAWWGIVTGKGPPNVVGISCVRYLTLLVELAELRAKLAGIA